MKSYYDDINVSKNEIKIMNYSVMILKEIYEN